ncbi:alpha/beta fold hydrolase [Herbiconiux ginsengi]|uniref:Pimeloyl-ACP methyl ester carboxylesterase n=1 Tax=Herbiconiux ginsengi TaxID=381665 RepID=A0A1H3LWI0_9MICO|nr:alpha/beta hydrolase [Herbiconiux ginsengi]SDY68716.1 Pimeloyl-ACP methyl ester carboxylesterase [Herbiconiux ginsengi]
MMTRIPPPPIGAGRRPRADHIVLVHGAYADGSCWSDVIPLLQRAGLDVTAVQNPLTSLADDAAATRRALALKDGLAVLVGHSWAGTVISEVGGDDRVSALVYIAARAPDAGEDYPALASQFPMPPASAGLVHADGFARLSERAFLEDFANGVEASRARVLHAVQGAIADTLFSSSTTTAAWRIRSSFYAVSKQDRTTAPDLERFLAARMGASTVEIDSGHLSMITHPEDVARLILTAAGR